MASGSLEIVLLCYCALFRPYDLNILLAWHHARMLSCSHTRGVIMLLHFPAPTASCHALGLSSRHALLVSFPQALVEEGIR